MGKYSLIRTSTFQTFHSQISLSNEKVTKERWNIKKTKQEVQYYSVANVNGGSELFFNKEHFLI